MTESTAPHCPSTDLPSLLDHAVRGEVSFDLTTRGIHSTDASQYQIVPACVVWPHDAEDAMAAMRIAADHHLPITPRGAATSLSGQTMWSGMVLDMSRHMDQIIEINCTEQWARVQPGLIRDQLNQAVAKFDLHFAPDPATASRATVGGMIGNNSSGMHSIVYGKTSDHVLELTIGLGDGTVMTLTDRSAADWTAIETRADRAGDIHRTFRKLIQANRAEIEKRFPNLPRRVSGYNLDAFLHEPTDAQPWNLSNLIVGSEGTLALLLEAKLKLTPLPRATALCAVHFDDLIDSLRAVPAILEHQPAAIELIDDRIAKEARHNRAVARYAKFIEGIPASILITEFFADTPLEAAARANHLADQLKQAGIGYAHPICSDPADQDHVWQVRKLGLGLVSNVKGPQKRQPFVEDACVPVAALPDYITDVKRICDEHDVPMAIYGHASVGVLHVNPMLDLHQPEQVETMQTIAREVFHRVEHYGGSWSGEHGDGIVRGSFLKDFFGTRVYDTFEQVKDLFDPAHLMNPGKVVDCPPMTENLRYGKQYRIAEINASYHYHDQGGFALAVEQCNGVGACRKIGSGTMCPSYMATRNEEHSTRGRANTLRLAMTGQLNENDLTSDRVKEVLDLCLACKACKAECPNAVDMAKLKSDVLHMRNSARRLTMRDALVAESARMAKRIAGPLASPINALQRTGVFRGIMEKIAGTDRRRILPAYASQSFSSWFFQRRTGKRSYRKVVLFPDTFTNYYQPHVGQAAVKLLEGAGYEVIVAQAGCCQRTRLSKGLLDHAKRDGTATFRRLDKYAAQNLSILTLEPSCASALADDLPDLIDDASLGRRVARQIKPLEQFIAEQMQAGLFTASLKCDHPELLIHQHCHDKALFDGDALSYILKRVPGLTTCDTQAGCCGMAGAFGYEHYDLSMKIAEDRLVPAIRAKSPEAAVVATGFSCRHQIADAAHTDAKHWVELIYVAQDNACPPPPPSSHKPGAMVTLA